MTHPIPPAALADHIAILGKTGAGKSNAAKTVAEDLMDRGERVCVIDPTGTWWGLRLDANGKKPSRFPVVIFGGQRGDMAIDASHGAAIAEIVGTSSTPAIIDTRMMSVGARTQFFTAFAEALMQKITGTLHLFIDEAHLFAPQGKVNDPKSGMMLGAANNLVSLGRGLGLRIVLLTQRPQKLSKDTLTQTETLVAMRVTHPLDIDAAEDWFGRGKRGRAIAEQVVGQLPALPNGAAVLYSPQLGVTERVQFPLVSTFDSGKPRAGDEARALAPIDLKAVAAQLETIAKDVVANDPARLKAQIAKLQAENTRLQKQAPAAAPDPKAIEDAEARDHEAGVEIGYAEGWRTADAEWRDRLTDLLGAESEGKPRTPPPQKARVVAAVPTRPAVTPAPRPAPAPRPPVEGNGALPPARQKIIDAIAWLGMIGNTAPDKTTLAHFVGVSPTSGGYFNNLGALRSAGLVDYPEGGRVALTAAGQELAVAPAVPPDHDAIMALVAGKTPPAQMRVLQALVEVWPNALAKNALAAAIDVSPTSGGFFNNLGRLRSMGLITYPSPGEARAADILFP